MAAEKYRLWRVSVDGYQTLIWARTPQVAADEAVHEMHTVRVTEATKTDIAWQEAMGGGVPPKPKEG